MHSLVFTVIAFGCVLLANASFIGTGNEGEKDCLVGRKDTTSVICSTDSLTFGKGLGQTSRTSRFTSVIIICLNLFTNTVLFNPISYRTNRPQKQ